MCESGSHTSLPVLRGEIEAREGAQATTHDDRSLSKSKRIRVGVAIPAHNRIERTRECLAALRASVGQAELVVVVVDDGSQDGTSEIVSAEFPEVVLLHGDGSLWWTGATNLAVEWCLKTGCDYVLLLNQDCQVRPYTIERLLEHCESSPRTISAAVEVDTETHRCIQWAGTRWGPARGFPWAYGPRAVLPVGSPIDDLPAEPIACDMTGGRGLLIPQAALDELGLFDYRRLPQYGADTDFSLRARERGYLIHVVPGALVATRSGDTVSLVGAGQQSFARRAFSLLFRRRGGEVAIIWWTLARRHAPQIGGLPTYLRILGVTLKRAWNESREATIKA